MKSLFVFGLFIFALTSCTKTESVEDQLYDCLKSKYASNDIDLESSLDDLEQKMIDQEILIDRGGLAKIKFYENIVETGHVPTFDTPKTDQFFGLAEHREFLSNCRSTIKKKDSSAYTKSKFNRFINFVQLIATKEGELNPVTVSKAILKSLSAQDFEHPYYRAYCLITFAISAKVESPLLNDHHEPSHQDGEVHDIHKDLTIILREDHMVRIGEIEVHINEAYEVFKNSLDSIDFAPAIHLDISSKTKYEDYMTIQSYIDRYTNELFDAESIRSFNLSFEQLDDNQKAQVKNAHPIKIVEHPY